MRDLVYISYSQRDVHFRDELRQLLERDIRICDLIWDDSKISPGANWKAVIDSQVDRARLMVMLVSKSYIDSSCQAWQCEIPKAFEALKKGELSILWVPVDGVDLGGTPFLDIRSVVPLSETLASKNESARESVYESIRDLIANQIVADDRKSFDVFLSHNSKDKEDVRRLAEMLKERGLRIWFDEWELIPGCKWQDQLEEIVKNCSAAAVCVGGKGIGPWEDEEMDALLRRFIQEKKKGRSIPVIPILLPGTPSEVEMPLFLDGFHTVNLIDGLTDLGVDQIVRGVTGRKLPKQNQTPGPLNSKWLRASILVGALFLIAYVTFHLLQGPNHEPPLNDPKSIQARSFESALNDAKRLLRDGEWDAANKAFSKLLNSQAVPEVERPKIQDAINRCKWKEGMAMLEPLRHLEQNDKISDLKGRLEKDGINLNLADEPKDPYSEEN